MNAQLESHIKVLKEELGYSNLQIRIILKNPNSKRLLELSPKNFPTQIKLPPHLQAIADKTKNHCIEDVTPEGYGPAIQN